MRPSKLFIIVYEHYNLNFDIFDATGIQLAELRHNGATLSLTRRTMEPGPLLHSALTRPSSANARRLKSRQPFVLAAQQLVSLSDNNIRAAHWADHQWNAEWADRPTLQDSAFSSPTPAPTPPE